MMEILLNIFISLSLKSLFTLAYPFVDWMLYGEKYEGKIQRGKANEVNAIIRWLFTEYDLPFFPKAVPFYRVFQKLMLFGYWGYAYYIFYSEFPLWIQLIDLGFGVFFALFYMMVFEKLYYNYGNQNHLLQDYSKIRVINGILQNEDTYWLKRIWFIGLLIFRDKITDTGAIDHGFTYLKFETCFYIGISLAVISTFVHFLKGVI